MSNVYLQEPQTRGKIVLSTTHGDIPIELWTKESPKACRNVIQLCLEGYYDGTPFHRLIPGFIIQGGDPTGTGLGGESIYGEDGFEMEAHSRLRFTRRGMVAMAGTGKETNGSQFFITLDNAEELNGKHTIFGKVVGDGIYVVLKMAESEVDSRERIVNPPRIIKTRVSLNPFEDIAPRITKQELLARSQREKGATTKVEGKKSGKKNVALLSFGNDDEEVAPEMKKKGGIRSSHDVLVDDPRLRKDVAVDVASLAKEKKAIENMKKTIRSVESNDTPTRETTDSSAPMTDVVKTSSSRDYRQVVAIADTQASKRAASDPRMLAPASSKEAQSEMDKLRDEIRALKGKKASKPSSSVQNVNTNEKGTGKEVKRKSALEEFNAEFFAKRPKVEKALKRGESRAQEDETMAKLQNFTSRLWLNRPTTLQKHTSQDDPAGKERCGLHGVVECESCYALFHKPIATLAGDDNTEDVPLEFSRAEEEGWLEHTLVFEKDTKGKDLMSRRDDVNDYVVYDSRINEVHEKQEKRRKQEEEKMWRVQQHR